MQNIACRLTTGGVRFQCQHHSITKATQNDGIVARTQRSSVDQNVIEGRLQLSHTCAHSLRPEHRKPRLRRAAATNQPKVARIAVNVVSNRARPDQSVRETVMILDAELAMQAG